VATNASIKVIKQFNFKGGIRQWSNRYHFNGGTPVDATHWHTLMDNVVTAEKAIHASTITIVECIGYAAGSEIPVASKTYTTTGTATPAGSSVSVPGECAALARLSTGARTTKNHPIYLYSYYHGVTRLVSAGVFDTLDAAQRTAIDTYCGSWITGFSDGTITAVRASPQGAAATGHQVEEYLTHRDFPYTRSL
jgi:hypothetical protein